MMVKKYHLNKYLTRRRSARACSVCAAAVRAQALLWAQRRISKVI